MTRFLIKLICLCLFNTALSYVPQKVMGHNFNIFQDVLFFCGVFFPEGFSDGGKESADMDAVTSWALQAAEHDLQAAVAENEARELAKINADGARHMQELALTAEQIIDEENREWINRQTALGIIAGMEQAGYDAEGHWHRPEGEL